MRRVVIGAAIAGVLACVAALFFWLRADAPAPTPPPREAPAGPSAPAPANAPADAAPAPKRQPPVPPARPGLQSDWDKAQLGSHAATIQACADDHPATPPGILRLRVLLTAQGTVKEVEVTDPKFKDLEVAECVTTEIRSKQFPAGAEDRTVTHIFRVR